MICCDAVEYGGEWYLLQLGGNVSALMGIQTTAAGTFPTEGLDLDIEGHIYDEPRKHASMREEDIVGGFVHIENDMFQLNFDSDGSLSMAGDDGQESVSVGTWRMIDSNVEIDFNNFDEYDGTATFSQLSPTVFGMYLDDIGFLYFVRLPQ